MMLRKDELFMAYNSFEMSVLHFILWDKDALSHLCAYTIRYMSSSIFTIVHLLHVTVGEHDSFPSTYNCKSSIIYLCVWCQYQVYISCVGIHSYISLMLGL